jgi:hypothetical protein
MVLLILKLKDNTASARKRMKVRDRLSSFAPLVIGIRNYAMYSQKGAECGESGDRAVALW